ncbi:MAG: exodeoxyribonuclease VII large subunit, partial [Eubacteriales bacterium]|nr:exodeoxyribonuclease VII large subunit [Eubacteriales bacterium]
MNKNIYSVSQINNYIKLLLEDDVLLNDIFIKGEISNFKKHTSGHIYFTIKDENASINSVMYSSNALNIDFEIENGMQVTVFGYVSSYVKTGQYQFYAKEINLLGKGDLKRDFEALKEKLFKQGFFDEEAKKIIPKFPKNIGVITSPTGAAIQDIINIYKRRNQSVNLILIPTLVQGDSADLEIINAIKIANEYKKIDTLILARGGGSYEDLDCFNSEELAKAIYFSEIPIITGIGHEIDFTIADFVSDFRAPTPSAAIEIALPEYNILQEKLEQNYD